MKIKKENLILFITLMSILYSTTIIKADTTPKNKNNHKLEYITN